MQWLLPATLVVMALAGCHLEPPRASEMVVISGVPEFSSQARADDCASVALASLLIHFGQQVTPAAIDQQIYDPVIRGSMMPDMENYLSAQGVQPRTGRGNLGLLRSRLAEGSPVLLPIDLGWSVWRRPHYIVVFGFDRQSFLMHKQPGGATTMSAEELDRRWEKMGYLYLHLE